MIYCNINIAFFILQETSGIGSGFGIFLIKAEGIRYSRKHGFVHKLKGDFLKSPKDEELRRLKLNHQVQTL